MQPPVFSSIHKESNLRQLVSDHSACLIGFPRQGLQATHSGMNKFDSPENGNFRLVKDTIRGFAKNASSVLSRRSDGKSGLSRWVPDSIETSRSNVSQASQKYHWIVPFGRNSDFVGRESILEQLVEK